MTSDFELLEAWHDGDRQSGDELFQRHFDSLYRFFARKTAGDVEDLVQRTFLACVEGREAFRGQASFRTYLFAIARNQLYRYWRTRSRSGEVDFTVKTLQDLGPTPSIAVKAQQEQRLLLEGLRRIPLDLQIALELHYWEGMSGPDIAVVLDVAEGTVRSRLRRGREMLVAKLEELAESAEVLQATTCNLDRWAASLKDLVQ